MNKLNTFINIGTNISVYLIYISIASLSIVISYKVSVILALMVIPIELLRLIAIHRKMHKFIAAVILLNLALIGYSSYKLEVSIKDNNQVIETNNQSITSYINRVWLKSGSFDKKLDKTQFKQIDVSYLVITIGYTLFEALMFCFIRELNNQAKKEQKKPIKQVKLAKPTPTSKPIKQDIKRQENTEEALQCVGNYVEYSKQHNISRTKAKELFKEWESKGLLIKKDRKNYLKEVKNA